MDTVRSNNGTLIAFERSGTGPPFVLVHGTTADHTRWAGVLPGFEKNFIRLCRFSRKAQAERRGQGETPEKKAHCPMMHII